MQKDVAWLCMVLGSYPVLPDVHMHMCIMKASTGTYMDIEEHGYVQRYLARHWRDARGEIATFRPQVPPRVPHDVLARICALVRYARVQTAPCASRCRSLTCTAWCTSRIWRGFGAACSARVAVRTPTS